MSRTRLIVPSNFIRVDRALPISLERQVYSSLRQAIRDGLLRPGSRLPATRLLSLDLGVSRNTIVDAYQRLIAEGYARANAGGGTFVSPQQFVPATPPKEAVIPLSPFGHAAKRASAAIPASGAFSPGLPALDEFPRAKWSQLMQIRWRSTPLTLSGLDAVLGLRSLREAIAEHIAPMRGIVCSPEQVVITTGRRSGLVCIFRALADRSEAVLVEDPCDIAVHDLIQALQLKPIGADVDREGLKLDALYQIHPRIAYVTPARQYPLGTQMSLGRRYELLEWAKKLDVTVVEDEYDGFFNDNTPQGQSLKAIDVRGRVIYAGSFASSLSPFMNLGFIIAPPGFALLTGQARSMIGAVPAAPEQAALADFIRGGDFARHVQRMYGVYAERREILRSELTNQLAGFVRATTESGMNLIAWLAPEIDDADVSAAASRRGIDAPALSHFSINRELQPALVLGYGATAPDAIPDAVRTLAMAIEATPAKAS